MSAEAIISKKPLEVLVVDDDPTMLLLTQLRINGFERFKSTTSNDPEEALDWIQKDPYRFPIIFSDVDMSPIDGITFGAGVRRENPDAVIIFHSGRPSNYISERDPNIMDLYLQKPSRLPELEAVLNQAQRIYRERLIKASPQ